MSHLVLLSGGPDSLYSLKKVLTETEDPVHVLHLSNTTTKRWGMEKLAADMQVRQCRLRFRKFKYDWASVILPKLANISDIPLLAPFAAAMANSLKDVHKTWLGVDEDYDDKPAGRAFRLGMAACMMEERHKVPPPEEFFPPLDLWVTKQEVREYIGETLWRMSWSCRNPSGSEPCETCYACVKRLKTTAPNGAAQ